jgi:hypothetical protein
VNNLSFHSWLGDKTPKFFHSFNKKKFTILTGVILLAGTLGGCGLVNTNNVTPTNTQIISTINLLINQYEKNYPKLKNWSDQAVARELSGNIPTGIATRGGWEINWPNAASDQFSSVLLPWTLLGIYPNQTSNNFHLYLDSGREVAGSTYDQLQQIEDKQHPIFAGVEDARQSNIDGSWVIFTLTPYLPVTDSGYGFAHHENGNWKIVDFGSARVGCQITPGAIEKEFGFIC